MVTGYCLWRRFCAGLSTARQIASWLIHWPADGVCHCRGMSFDLILAAEVLYTEAHCRKVSFRRLECSMLIRRSCLFIATQVTFVLERLLSQPNQRAILANKRYYFGTGGGSSLFEQCVHRLAPSLSVTTARSFEDGQSNIRDIQIVTRRP